MLYPIESLCSLGFFFTVSMEINKKPSFWCIFHKMFHDMPFLVYIFYIVNQRFSGSVSWGYRIHWLHLCRGVTSPPQQVPSWYDIKQSDGKASIILKLWGMWSNPWLPSLPGPLWLGVVVPERVQSIGQIELKCHYVKLIFFKLTVFTFSYVFKMCTYGKMSCLK